MGRNGFHYGGATSISGTLKIDIKKLANLRVPQDKENSPTPERGSTPGTPLSAPGVVIRCQVWSSGARCGRPVPGVFSTPGTVPGGTGLSGLGLHYDWDNQRVAFNLFVYELVQCFAKEFFYFRPL